VERKDWNIIVIMLDSLRQDHVGCYGGPVAAAKAATPNLDRFAAQSVIFENAYPESLPTLPVRTSLFTGNRTLHSRPWQPLAPEDLPMAEILDEYGYVSALIADTYHLFKPNMNYHRGFRTFRWIRGQEADAYISAPHSRDLRDYTKPAMEGRPTWAIIDQYFLNTSMWQKEEDYFVAQVMREAARWLEGNSGHPHFFLWIDSFDPHEPWDPPPKYEQMYADPDYSGPRLIHPMYGSVDWMTPEELNYVRALYAGEVTFVDKWFGYLLDVIIGLGLLDNSIIVVLADHGHPHGDHGSTMKTPDNLYSELLRIPLLIRHPEGLYAGKRVSPLVQTDDLLPTLLDLLNLPQESIAMTGKSVWPLVTGEAERLREFVVTGFHDSEHRCLRDEEWSYIKRPAGEAPELYNLLQDPTEQHNLAAEHPEELQRMAGQLPRGFQILQPKFSTIQLQYEVSGTPVYKTSAQMRKLMRPKG
jgi:arylsulfatase A-like enzyme